MRINKQVAIVHPRFTVGGGSEAVPLWVAEALKRDYDVTLITMGRVDLEKLNNAYGTHLTRDEIRIVEIPIPFFCKKRFDALRGYRLARYSKKVARDYNLIMSTYNVMDFGLKGMQFIADFSFADNLRRQFDDNNKVLYRDSMPRRLYIGFGKMLSGTTADGWKKNITIANSDWSGRIMKEVYGIETNTIYPPVVGDYPDIPWHEREEGFICLGRLSSEKRIERMIEILRKVRQRGRDIHLHIVGTAVDSGYLSELKKLVAENSSWVFLEGGKFGTEKLEFLARHKYGIHGRSQEPFGIAVAEMVKAGCITFVPDGGGQVEIVGHKELLYSDVFDAMEKIDRILTCRELSEEIRLHLEVQAKLFSGNIFMSEVIISVNEFMAH